MLEKYMKFKKFLLMVIIVLALGILAVTGIQIYQERVKTENEYKELAVADQEEQKAQRELERQSNFYEKLEKVCDSTLHSSIDLYNNRWDNSGWRAGADRWEAYGFRRRGAAGQDDSGFWRGDDVARASVMYLYGD